MKVATTPQLKNLLDPDTIELNFGEEIDKNIKTILRKDRRRCEKKQIVKKNPSGCLIQ